MAASGIGSSGERQSYGRRSTASVADKKVSSWQRASMEDVVIDPDYTLAIMVAALCPLIIWYHPCTIDSFRSNYVRE
jgi:hypothetical protein